MSSRSNFGLKTTNSLEVFAHIGRGKSYKSPSAQNSSKINIIPPRHFSPPSPFPASLYNVTVVYETNPETQSLTSVSVPTGSDSKKRKAPETLRRWIDTRLENPLLKLDVATLCWGINRYWESAITRARLWAHIDHKYGPRALQSRKDTAPESKNGVITLSELRRLVPHLDRSAMVIKPKSSDSSPRVLLSNTLVLDE